MAQLKDYSAKWETASAGSTISLTNVVAGTCLLVELEISASQDPTTSLTCDGAGAGNHFDPVGSPVTQDSPGTGRNEVWIATNVAGGSYTLTVNGPTNTIGIIVLQFHGVDPTNPVAASSFDHANSANVNSGSVTAGAGSMLFGFVVLATTASTPTGWTQRSTLSGNEFDTRVAPGGSITYSQTVTSGWWVAGIVALNLAPGVFRTETHAVAYGYTAIDAEEPPGTQDGDIMLMALWAQAGAWSTLTFFEQGWQLLDSFTAGDVPARVYWRRRSGASTPRVDWTGNYNCYQIVASYVGALGDPTKVSASGQANPANPDPGAMTMAVGDVSVVVGFATYWWSAEAVPPTGYTLRAGPTSYQAAIADKKIDTAGSEDPPAFSGMGGTLEYWAATTVRLTTSVHRMTGALLRSIQPAPITGGNTPAGSIFQRTIGKFINGLFSSTDLSATLLPQKQGGQNQQNFDGSSTPTGLLTKLSSKLLSGKLGYLPEFTDDFNRANGGLGSNWLDTVGAFAIESNRAAPTNEGWNETLVWAVAGGGNSALYSAATVSLVGTNPHSFYLWNRVDSGSNGYWGGFDEDGNWKIQRVDSAVGTVLASASGTLQAGDRLLFLSLQNGEQRLFVNGSLVVSAIDSTHTGGGTRPFVVRTRSVSNDHVSFDDYECGRTHPPIGSLLKTSAKTLLGKLSGGEEITDSYSETNWNTYNWLSSVDGHGGGQVFQAGSGLLTKAAFYLRRRGSALNGSVYARVYAITGTPGTNAVPTGAALAVSDAVDPMSVTETSPPPAMTEFVFSGANRINLTPGTWYAAVCEYSAGDANNGFALYHDSTSPTHSGNRVTLSVSDTWGAWSTNDTCFRVYQLATSLTGALLKSIGKLFFGNFPRLCSDAFTDANGTALTTHDANWAELVSGYLEIQSNRASPTTAAQWHGIRARYTASQSDTSEIVFVSNGTNGGHYSGGKSVNVRMTASDSGYGASIATGGTTVTIAKNGAWLVDIAFGQSFSDAVNHRVKIQARGNANPVTLEVWVDGTSYGTYQDSSSPITAPGNPGFYCNYYDDPTSARFDDWNDGAVGATGSLLKQAAKILSGRFSGGQLLSRSDSFDGADGSPGANWTTTNSNSAVTVVSHQLKGTAVGINGCYWNADSPDPDQWSEIRVVTYDGSNAYIGPRCRQSASADAYYVLQVAADGWRFAKFVAGNGIVLGSAVPHSVPGGHLWRLQVTGTGAVVTLRAFVDGALVGTYDDMASDRITTAGFLGIFLRNTTVVADDWAGGNIASLTGSLLKSIGKLFEAKSGIVRTQAFYVDADGQNYAECSFDATGASELVVTVATGQDIGRSPSGGATFNGVSMTTLAANSATGPTRTITAAIYRLSAPAQGVNTFRVTFDGTLTNGGAVISCYALRGVRAFGTVWTGNDTWHGIAHAMPEATTLIDVVSVHQGATDLHSDTTGVTVVANGSDTEGDALGGSSYAQGPVTMTWDWTTTEWVRMAVLPVFWADQPVGSLLKTAAKVLSGLFNFVRPNLINQSFEGAGYDNGETWTESSSGSVTWDSDSVGPGSLPVGGGSQCLHVVVAAGAEAIAKNDTGATRSTSYTRAWVYFSSLTIANTQELLVLQLYVTGGTTRTMVFGVFHNGSQAVWRGGYHISNVWQYFSSSAAVQTGVWYLLEIGKTAAGDVEFRVNGVSLGSASGVTLDRGEPRVWGIGLAPGISTPAADAYIDLVGVDSTQWIGPVAMSGSLLKSIGKFFIGRSRNEFGKAVIGGSNEQPYYGRLFFSGPYVAPTDGQLTELALYANISATNPANVTMGVFDATGVDPANGPHNRLALTAGGALSSGEGWKFQSLTSPLSVTGGTSYFLVWYFGDPGGGTNNFYYDASNGWWIGEAYSQGSMPSHIADSVLSGGATWSMRALFTPSPSGALQTQKSGGGNQQNFDGSSTPTGLLSKASAKVLDATQATGGALLKTMSKLLAGGFAGGGATQIGSAELFVYAGTAPSITIPSDCTLMLVGYAWAGSETPTFSISGTSLDLVVRRTYSGGVNGAAEIHRYLNPPTGSRTLTVAGTATGAIIIVAYFKGNHGTTPIRDSDSQAPTSNYDYYQTLETPAFDAIAGDLAVAMVFDYSGDNYADAAPAGAGQTQLGEIHTGSVTSGAMGMKAIASGTTTTMKGSGNYCGLVACSIAAAGSGGIVGTFTRSIQKFILAGSTPAGAFVRAVWKTIFGTLTPTGDVPHQKQGANQETLEGTAVPTGTVSKVSTLARTGGLTPVGTFTRGIQKALLAGLTPVGAFSRRLQKTILAGLTPAGTFTRSVRKVLLASFTPAGALTKTLPRVIQGLTQPTGTFARGVQKTLLGTWATAGTFARGVRKIVLAGLAATADVIRQKQGMNWQVFPGEMTPGGTVQKTSAKTMAGTQATGGVVLKTTRKIYAGVFAAGAMTGTFARGVQKALQGGFTPVGTFIRSLRRAFLGGVAPEADVLRQKQGTNWQIFPGDMGLSGTLSKRSTLTRTGGTTPAGTLARAIQKAVLAGLTPAGAVTRRVQKALLAGLTPVGAFARSVRQTILGGVTPAGTRAAALVKVLLGGTQPAGTTIRRVQKALQGGFTPVGTFIKGRITVIRTGLLSPAGALLKRTARTLLGQTQPTATLVKEKVRLLQGGLTPIGTTIRWAIKPVTATLGTLGTLALRTQKVLFGGTQPTGTVSRWRIVTRLWTGTQATLGLFTRVVSRILGGTASPAGDVRKTSARSLAGTLATAGMVTKRQFRQFAGLLTPTATMVHRWVGELLNPLYTFIRFVFLRKPTLKDEALTASTFADEHLTKSSMIHESLEKSS